MNLFPIVEGMPTKLASGITYALCSNGVFECRKLPGGGMVSTKVDGVKGLPEGKEEIRFLSKKVPVRIYCEILRFFRSVEKHYKANLEAYVEIGYNPSTEDYFLYAPQQFVGPASVKYEINDFVKDNPGCWIIGNFHSHPTFSAYFSGTDDKNDVRDQFSGVVGNIQKAMPEVNIRFAAGGKHIPLTFEDLFCTDDCSYKFDVDAAVKQVNHINTNIVTSGSSNGYVPNNNNPWADKSLEKYNAWRGLGNSIYSSGRDTSMYDLVKSSSKKGFSVSDLMGADW
jgi:PRTRC genetic system protein A